MDLKIAIVDDSSADREYIRTLAESWGSERGLGVSTAAFPSAESFLFAWDGDKSWDVLLLDIEMGSTDGVTLARSIRRESKTVQLVFTTGYSEYILDGYEVAALHYLLKPVSPEKLFPVLDRAVDAIAKNDRFLTLETAEATERIALGDLLWLEVRANNVTLHTQKGDITVKRTLSELEEMLAERFFRTGRSYIVNLNAVRRVTKREVLLSSGESVPLSRGVYEPLNRAIINMK